MQNTRCSFASDKEEWCVSFRIKRACFAVLVQQPIVGDSMTIGLQFGYGEFIRQRFPSRVRELPCFQTDGSYFVNGFSVAAFVFIPMMSKPFLVAHSVISVMSSAERILPRHFCGHAADLPVSRS